MPFETDLLEAWKWWTSLAPAPENPTLNPTLIPSLKLVAEFHGRLFQSKPDMSPGITKRSSNFIQISARPAQYLHLCSPAGVEENYERLRSEMFCLLESFTDLQAHPATSVGMVERATFVAHYHARFIQIHPFDDGNGRLSRLIGYAQRILLFPDFDFAVPGSTEPVDSHLYYGVDAASYRAFMQKAHENLFYLIQYWMPGPEDAKPRASFPCPPPFTIPHVVRHYPPS